MINQDGTINSISNPAPGGSIVTFFVTGFQSSFGPLADGQVATVANNDACALESGCPITAASVAFFHLGSLSISHDSLVRGRSAEELAGHKIRLQPVVLKSLLGAEIRCLGDLRWVPNRELRQLHYIGIKNAHQLHDVLRRMEHGDGSGLGGGEKR